MVIYFKLIGDYCITMWKINTSKFWLRSAVNAWLLSFLIYSAILCPVILCFWQNTNYVYNSKQKEKVFIPSNLSLCFSDQFCLHNLFIVKFLYILNKFQQFHLSQRNGRVRDILSIATIYISGFGSVMLYS